MLVCRRVLAGGSGESTIMVSHNVGYVDGSQISKVTLPHIEQG